MASINLYAGKEHNVFYPNIIYQYPAKYPAASCEA